ncbi:beta-lactamase/transpeptidase-like protein [Ampelomyces quisqualis]|uniref:Beta-lactamase/transpeptidase-like protein n=1 Tax=Ampelomyces quisqualis TaxID=50730 RepID=A0A6A5QE22_AMPQU|nr:beta-lactamase/transpeptidase-like protein [Ampelomyces quisqualis]
MESNPRLISRLSGVREYAESIMKIGGTPGAAIAILHEGELVYSEYLGLRDQENQLPVDEETIFPCASLTKAVVSAAMAICVEEGRLGWNTPVKDIVPGFHTQDETLHQQMTTVDCLTHRAGMQSTLYWLGSNNNILVPNNKSLDFVNDLERVERFRDHYLYNNLGYEIAAHVLNSVTGNVWDQMLQKRIFEPLEMARTGTRAYFRTDNVAKTYMTLDDASNIEVTPMLSGGDTVGGPGSAMRSCVKDLVKLYASFLNAGKHQFESSTTSTPGSPLKQVPFLWSPKISMNPITYRETSYAMGWARVQTPGPMGAIGINPSLLAPSQMPLVGRGVPSTLILYHQGCMPGNLAAVNLIPESRGAILVLTNSLALNDTADWLGELYLEAYLDVQEKNDYVSLAHISARNALDWYPKLEAELSRMKSPESPPRELPAYVGTYRNRARTMMLQVSVNEQNGSLSVIFEGLKDEVWTLFHNHADVFTWLVPRNDFSHRGRFTTNWFDTEYFIFNFYGIPDDNNIVGLTWKHDPSLQGPQPFIKE